MERFSFCKRVQVCNSYDNGMAIISGQTNALPEVVIYNLTAFYWWEQLNQTLIVFKLSQG